MLSTCRFLAVRGLLPGAMVVSLCCLAWPAVAQEQDAIPLPRVELSAGYSVLYDTEKLGLESAGLVPRGWYTSASVNVTDWMAIVGETAASYATNWNTSYSNISISADRRTWAVLGGTRFFRKYGRLAPYAQMLAGYGQRRRTNRFSGAYVLTDTRTLDAFALQPGGGLTVFLTPSLGVRFAGDLRTLISSWDDEGPNPEPNQFRFSAGLNLQWGTR